MMGQQNNIKDKLNQWCGFKIVRLLVATLHVGMTQKQDGGYTQ